MSTERIFGGWDVSPTDGLIDGPSILWHGLAAQGVGKANFQQNFGLTQRRAEITLLWELFLRARPKVILEIGTAQGGTLAGWCQLAGWYCTIIAIDRDLNDCRPRQGEPAVHEKLATPGKYGMAALARPTQTLYGIQGWSYEPQVMEALLKVLNGRKIDWIFHDASHSAAMFAKDFELYWPLVADGGVFSTHDINWSADPNCDKKTTWRLIRENAQYSAVYEFLPHHSVSEMGIGVLIR